RPPFFSGDILDQRLLRRLRPCAVAEQPRLARLAFLVDRAGFGFVGAVEAGPDVVPDSAGGGLRVLGRAGFEEVSVLDAVDQRGEPGERVVVDHAARRQARHYAAFLRGRVMSPRPASRPATEISSSISSQWMP